MLNPHEKSLPHLRYGRYSVPFIPAFSSAIYVGDADYRRGFLVIKNRRPCEERAGVTENLPGLAVEPAEENFSAIFSQRLQESLIFMPLDKALDFGFPKFKVLSWHSQPFVKEDFLHYCWHDDIRQHQQWKR